MKKKVKIAVQGFLGELVGWVTGVRAQAILIIAALSISCGAELKVTPVPSNVREEFKLAPFYEKFVSVGGLPIVGSAKVSDHAIAECAWLVQRMLEKRADILTALAEAKVRFAIMAHDEYTTDIPEHAHLKPRVYWDRRARGLGATPNAPAVSGGEENVLAFPGDPYPQEIICIHEFAHAIHGVGLKTVDPTFDARLRAVYETAMTSGLWKNTYAAVNRQEYWAEAVQAWFDNNDANDALHNDVSTREKLKAYDPGIAALCAEVFGDGPWRYQKPADRSPDGRAHLEGYDPAKAPLFRWRQEVVPVVPKVTFHCAEGEIEWELSGPRDRLAQLLGQIHEGYFSGGKAIFSGEQLRLEPAEYMPDGTAIPQGEGRWTIHFGAPSDSGITANTLKGAAILAKLVKTKGGSMRVQRMVRLN